MARRGNPQKFLSKTVYTTYQKGEINMRNNEASNSVINFRLTAEEKQKIKEVAAAKGMNVSDFIRYACERIFAMEDDLK